MIDGITILNNVTVSDFNPIPWLIVLIGFLIVFTIICIANNIGANPDTIGLGCVILCAIFGITLVLFIADIHDSKVDAIQCTIEDDVSINEVYDNYDVIDKQGDIWTLKEKTK